MEDPEGRAAIRERRGGAVGTEVVLNAASNAALNTVRRATRAPPRCLLVTLGEWIRLDQIGRLGNHLELLHRWWLSWIFT